MKTNNPDYSILVSRNESTYTLFVPELGCSAEHENIEKAFSELDEKINNTKNLLDEFGITFTPAQERARPLGSRKKRFWSVVRFLIIVLVILLVIGFSVLSVLSVYKAARPYIGSMLRDTTTLIENTTSLVTNTNALVEHVYSTVNETNARLNQVLAKSGGLLTAVGETNRKTSVLLEAVSDEMNRVSNDLEKARNKLGTFLSQDRLGTIQNQITSAGHQLGESAESNVGLLEKLFEGYVDANDDLLKAYTTTELRNTMFADYVGDHADLLESYTASAEGLTKSSWGERHYCTIGRFDGRTYRELSNASCGWSDFVDLDTKAHWGKRHYCTRGLNEGRTYQGLSVTSCN